MEKQEFKKLIAAIEAGQFTPSQMEDVVYAMHAAYVDHHEAICDQLPTNLEDVADTMVVARHNAEKVEDAEELPLRQCDEEGARQRYASRLEHMTEAA